MKENLYIARSLDKEILKKAENGGAVTSLLKFALKSGRVDSVLTIKARDGDRYDGIPVLINNPEELLETAGSLHCSSVNISRFLKEYVDGAANLKIAVTVKPCDAKAIIEIAKRNQITLDNLLLIGVNCTGTLLPARAKEMMQLEFGIDPADVIAEDIEDNKLTISLTDGTEKELALSGLEERGYGRRENCRRCETNIPVMADIACGKWGTTDKNSTFIEAFSDKGIEFIKAAIEAGDIEVEQPGNDAIKTRMKKDEAARELALQWQQKDFAENKKMSNDERFNYWFKQFDKCTKCYGCRDACPICYCKDCILETDRNFIPAGEIPPDDMFPLLRITHVMDSCVNCGQCQDACPVEIPLSRLIFMLNRELYDIFKYEPGIDISQLPPLQSVTEEELNISGVEVSF